MQTETLLTIDEYFDLPDKPGVFYELLQGRLIEMPAPTVGHGAIQTRTGGVLDRICQERFPDLFVASHAGFLLAPDTVQAPDVCVLRWSVYETAEVYRGAVKGAPELAVEIVSSSESAADLDDKVAAYLAAGTKTVWVMWPKRRHVTVHHRSGEVKDAALGDFAEAPEVLPGIKIAVESLFPVLTAAAS